MIYLRIIPHPALQAFVKEYMLLHFRYDPAKPPLVKPFPPLPEHGLEFFPKGLVTSVDPRTGIAKKEPGVAIFGQPVSRVNFLMPPEEYLMIRVIFHVGGLYRLLRVPLCEFTDLKVDAESVIGQEVRAINDRLANTANYTGMMEIVECYLMSKIWQVKVGSHAVDKIEQFLLQNSALLMLSYILYLLADTPGLHPKFTRAARSDRHPPDRLR